MAADADAAKLAEAEVDEVDAAVDGEEAQGRIDMVTLGMFIIDDIEFLPPRPPVRDVLGGAGSFAALGARLFSPAPTLSRTVGWIVDQGADFPAPMAALIDRWQTAVVLRADPDRLTTRGWNGYDVAEHRAFRYTTPKRRLAAADLPPALLRARAFHVISSAARCRELVADLLARRREAEAARRDDVGPRPKPPRPYIVWEPVPDRCTPDELLDCTNTLPLVDVCSPNHAELAAYIGDPDRGLDPATGRVSAAAVERACEQLLSAMPLQSYALVVRAAEHGCFVAKNGGRRRRRRAPDPSTAKAATVTATATATNTKKKDDELGHTRHTTIALHPPKPAAERVGTPAPAPPPKQDLHGGLRPDVDMEALFAGLQQDAEGMIAREEIEVDPGIEAWVPAVFGPGGESAEAGDETEEAGKKDEEREGVSPVVDPTGAGNAFMGALAVGLARGCSLDVAAAWGNVAASFAIQQIGVPVLGADADGHETWNGERVADRCAAYEKRLHRLGLLGGEPLWQPEGPLGE